MMFEHYVATEGGYDGGNVLISINGGAFELIPGTAFVHNAYPGSLSGVIDQNTNPKAGEEAFSGTNPNEQSGDWGQSQIDLAAAGAAPGDSVQLRWEFGQDGCNGNDGWYLDLVQVFSCASSAPPPAQECTAYPADMPVPSLITSLLASTTTATVSGQSGPVSDVNVRNLEGSHPYMGDLTFTLRSPSGTTRTLFDGAACAGEDGISAEFDDNAAGVIGCGDWLSGGTFKPFEALAAFRGENANGDWTLTVSDAVPRDEGTLDSWSLELCRDLPCAGEMATGGGWLAASGNGKINFGFNAKQKDTGPSGNLQLNDKSAGVKIDLKTVTSIGAVQGACGAIGESDHAIEIRGSGLFNKNTPATFRACVEDNGEGKKNGGGLPDRFHLECTSGCDYSTASRAPDDTIDGGNVQVLRKCNGIVSTPPAGNGGAATLILNPVLMTEGVVGTLQLLEVSVIGSNQQPLAGQSVSLTSVSANGAAQTLSAIANAGGKALFNVPIATQAQEYTAASNGVDSNALHLTPVF
jgi:subtilisin-like proprotein convertase family protein